EACAMSVTAVPRHWSAGCTCPSGMSPSSFKWTAIPAALALLTAAFAVNCGSGGDVGSQPTASTYNPTTVPLGNSNLSCPTQPGKVSSQQVQFQQQQQQ